MVWPFSSSKPDNPKAGSSSSSTISDAIDSIEHAGQDAKAAFDSTKASIEDIVASSSPSIEVVQQQLSYIPESASPYLITSSVFGVSILAVFLYRTRLRRIPTAAYLTPNMLKGKRILKGKVTSVGDSDNFRFYHTPGGVLAGWGWLRHVPTVSKGRTYERLCAPRAIMTSLQPGSPNDNLLVFVLFCFVELKEQTLHIRIAGVDAPEVSHLAWDQTNWKEIV